MANNNYPKVKRILENLNLNNVEIIPHQNEINDKNCLYITVRDKKTGKLIKYNNSTKITTSGIYREEPLKALFIKLDQGKDPFYKDTTSMKIRYSDVLNNVANTDIRNDYIITLNIFKMFNMIFSERIINDSDIIGILSDLNHKNFQKDINNLIIATLTRALVNTKKLQRYIETLNLFYGLTQADTLSLRIIADKYNVTGEKISQDIELLSGILFLEIKDADYFKNIVEKNIKTNAPSKNNTIFIAEELIPGKIYTEGAAKEIKVNAYERNPEARNACLKAYGNEYKCEICGFKFSDKYGEKFKEKIHVHHIKPLSEIQEGYVVNPEKDLIPVCPNCHLVLHSKGNGETYTVEEIKKIILK